MRPNAAPWSRRWLASETKEKSAGYVMNTAEPSVQKRPRTTAALPEATPIRDASPMKA